MRKQRKVQQVQRDAAQVRQGDVFLRRIGALPTGVRPVSRDKGHVILAYGEVTGHSHRVQEDNGATATLYEGEGGVRYLTIDELCSVVHEEHDTVTLEPGVYELPAQVEWSDDREPRQVQD